MARFEVDIRGDAGNEMLVELDRGGIEAEQLPGGTLLAIVEADSAGEAEARVAAIRELGSALVSVRRAPAREAGQAGGVDPAEDPFDTEIHPAHASTEGRR